MNEAKWYLRTQDETFGPETEERLLEWARLGRIQPGQEASDDNVVWQKVEEIPFLDMRFSIDLGDGNPRGPFHHDAAEALLKSGRLPPTAKIIEARPPFAVEAPKVVEELKEAEIKVVEKIIEVPVEKIVEKIVEVEKRIEVPVEKIVEKVVIDDKRVKELEGLLADSQARVTKLSEQVVALENELKRLPQAASEVADIQAAVFKIMQDESLEIANLIEKEKNEFEETKRRYFERADRLTERRRELLKRSGASLEDMTRKALIDHPEDPRTARLRHDYEELQRVHEQSVQDYERKLTLLNEDLKRSQTDALRESQGLKDITQLQAEAQQLREILQRTEQELIASRQQCEELRRREATNQQTLMARLKTLESPSIGTSSTIETNQSREAKMVKLPSWMKLKH